MPGLKEIRKRISSVKSTKQITKAMKMVAAAKFRKAQTRIIELRPYADKMHAVLAGLAGTVEAGHPLLEVRSRRKVEVVVLTSDKGLCGAFNANIMKAAFKLIKEIKAEGPEVSVSSVGKKGTDLFRRRGIPLRQSWVGISGRIFYGNAQEIARDIIENYTSESFDEVFLVYNEFRSALVQKVSVARLLPLAPVKEEKAREEAVDFLYEPSQQAIFEKLLPKNLEIQVFRALLESQASEEAARMTSMENATKAADDMIASLTLQYNKARQASITKELMDIVGGVEALKQ
ncbi:MAG: ATP synthase F1 subunit gamma [Alphaproteobacteria bacterium]|uniref:ATP synthase gamma chain n=1 Tax=Candidatus Nitrobium versatile TaxID=2884831 RepID=A0A953JBA2_9BACT|nr:ATP synthase F1 subunit gamma [Candidatus Nitrobium versatile]